MKHLVARPPVVVIAGDFLAHYTFGLPRAVTTMATLAKRFDHAFPDAQFVIALGNEDSACGGYRLAPGSPFLRQVATEWEPLVNRRHAAPGFARTFPRDGFYTATLPIPHAHVVVIDDVFWSPIYRARCTTAGAQPEHTLAELHDALLETPGTPHWVVAHIPPGVDASSTVHILHRLAVVPFLKPLQRQKFLALLANPSSHVGLVIAGHAHRFAYRIIERARSAPLPMILVPAISPVYRNAPSFLTVDVDADGTLQRAEEYAFSRDGWRDIGGTRSLGLADISGPSLVGLQRRLAEDAGLRAIFFRLYASGFSGDITESNWRVYWCAATAFETGSFRACLAQGGYGVLLGRGVVAVVGTAAFAAAGMSILFTVLFRRRRRQANARLEPR